jgi:hypothetical protein
MSHCDKSCQIMSFMLILSNHVFLVNSCHSFNLVLYFSEKWVNPGQGREEWRGVKICLPSPLATAVKKSRQKWNPSQRFPTACFLWHDAAHPPEHGPLNSTWQAERLTDYLMPQATMGERERKERERDNNRGTERNGSCCVLGGFRLLLACSCKVSLLQSITQFSPHIRFLSQEKALFAATTFCAKDLTIYTHHVKDDGWCWFNIACFIRDFQWIRNYVF